MRLVVPPAHNRSLLAEGLDPYSRAAYSVILTAHIQCSYACVTNGRLQGVLVCAGFLYPPGDYGAATAYVRKLVEDATLRAQMGREARLEVREYI